MKILAIGDFHGRFPVKLKEYFKDIDLILSVGDYAGIEEWRKYILYIFNLKDDEPRISPVEFYGARGFRELMKKDFRKGGDVLLALTKLKVPVISVFGNGDDEWYNYPFDKTILQQNKSRKKFLSKLKNFKDITYNTMKLGDISILGFGGYMDVSANFEKKRNGKAGGITKDYPTAFKRVRQTEKKLEGLLKRLKNKKRIFLFHYPPRGAFDVIKEKDNPYSGGSAGIDGFTRAIKKHKPGLVLCGHMHEYQGAKKIGSSVVINPGAAHDGKCAIIDFDEKRGKVKSVKFVK
jgi:Icc-related predicted phosphoesterase